MKVITFKLRLVLVISILIFLFLIYFLIAKFVHESETYKQKQQIEIIHKEFQINYDKLDTISYPGYSVNLLISLKRNITDSKAYIFDIGNSIIKDRLSLYLNKFNELCYRIVDTTEEVHTIVIEENATTFEFEKLLFITCEYGETDSSSFQRILLNGRLIEYHRFARNIGLAKKIKLEGSTLGADLNGNNCGSFLAASHSVAHATFTKIQINKFEEAMRRFILESNNPLMEVNCDNILRTGK